MPVYSLFEEEGGRPSLAEGFPEFRLWHRDELPEEWRQIYASPGYVAVELPDTPWGRQYHAWAVKELEKEMTDDTALPVMLTSMKDFRGENAEQRKQSAAEVLQCLAGHGKPPPFFARIMPTVDTQ